MSPKPAHELRLTKKQLDHCIFYHDRYRSWSRSQSLTTIPKLHFLPKRAYLHWLRWSLGKVFFFNRLQNLVTVSGGSPSPVVLTTTTNTSSFSRWNCWTVYGQMEGGVQLNKQVQLQQQVQGLLECWFSLHLKQEVQFSSCSSFMA